MQQILHQSAAFHISVTDPAVHPLAEISSRFCVARLSACTKLHMHVGYITDQPVANQSWWICTCLSFSVSSSIPAPGLFTKGVSVFSRSPAHAGI